MIHPTSPSIVFAFALVAGMVLVPAQLSAPAFAAEQIHSHVSVAGTKLVTLGSKLTANGAIASLQNEQGTPAWITSGTWKLTVQQSEDLSIKNAVFRAAFAMVKLDGTAGHKHTISDFKLSSWSADDTTKTFDGTVTVTLRDGPMRNVPVKITIMNGASVSIKIDPAVVSHFGDTAIYGTVARVRGGLVVDDSIHGVVPRDNGKLELAGLKRSTVNYYGDASGHLVYPEAERLPYGGSAAKLPAVIMIHEWWGLNQNIKNMAELLAKEGYVVLAVDLYGGQVASDQARARELVSAVSQNPAEAVANMNAAVRYVSALENVDSKRISSMGWCFGGGQSLQLALNAEKPLKATVIYYGSLVTEKERLATITWPVLGVFGDRDGGIPVDSVKAFEAALDSNGTPNEIHIYAGVGHAFANPSGDSFAPKEADDAWQKTIAFLKKYG